ncbi:YciI family protein [Propionibacteriaceae bacterium Y2011]|uniref:YciI family protein n=1 Tax=Microlunatus sp. Y2014 TaxID=3418488 RepID=UPI003B4F9AD0
MPDYMLSVMAERGKPPYATEEETKAAHAATGAFNDELIASGAFVFAGGLADIETATVVDGTGLEPITTDGPYSEAKEYLGGFWVVRAADLDEAIALAAAGSKACRGTVEIRPFDSV